MIREFLIKLGILIVCAAALAIAFNLWGGR